MSILTPNPPGLEIDDYNKKWWVYLYNMNMQKLNYILTSPERLFDVDFNGELRDWDYIKWNSSENCWELGNTVNPITTTTTTV